MTRFCRLWPDRKFYFTRVSKQKLYTCIFMFYLHMLGMFAGIYTYILKLCNMKVNYNDDDDEDSESYIKNTNCMQAQIRFRR